MRGRFALSFVTPLLLQALPVIHLVLGLLLAALDPGVSAAHRAHLVSPGRSEARAPGLWWHGQPNLCSGVNPRDRPIGGVDVTPVIWVGLISLVRELLVGQQGLLSQVLMHAQAVALRGAFPAPRIWCARRR